MGTNLVARYPRGDSIPTISRMIRIGDTYSSHDVTRAMSRELLLKGFSQEKVRQTLASQARKA